MKVVFTSTHLNLISQILYFRGPITKEVNAIFSDVRVNKDRQAVEF